MLGVPLAVWMVVVPAFPVFVVIAVRSTSGVPNALDKAFRELDSRGMTLAIIAVAAVTLGTVGHRRVGRAVRAHDLGPARRLARGDPLVERRGDLRRVPVGGELPRHRRASRCRSAYAALWQALGFTAGYLALLLFVAAPLRRFGSYTIPDFAEGRLASPSLRRLAVVAVLAIDGFYLVPQLKGAGIAFGEVMGAPYWAGVVVVGIVVTVYVALGGMRGCQLRAGVPVLGEDGDASRCRRSCC